jgi:hypothetical protein
MASSFLCRLHSFMLELDALGAPVAWYREHDTFDRYRGDEDQDDRVGLRIFKTADGKCPLDAVQGVRLIFNELHAEVMAKAKELNKVLDRFGESNAAELAALEGDDISPAGVRMSMVRDLISRRASMADYFKKYDTKMTQLQHAEEAGQEPRAEFLLAQLPAHTEELDTTAEQLLESLESAARTAAFSARVDNTADHDKHSPEAALLALQLAAKAHLDTSGRRNAVLPASMKRLRRLKRGDRRTDRDWSAEQTKQGDLVLCRIDEVPY